MKNDVIFVQIIGLVFLSGLGLGEPKCEKMIKMKKIFRNIFGRK